jgi:predicted MFS family arabinose efflux permease
LVAGAEARAYQLALIATGIMALPSIIPVLLLTEPARQETTSAATRSVTPRRLDPRRIDWQRIARLATGPIGMFSITQILVGFGAGLFGPYLGIYFVRHLGASTTYYGTLSAILAILMAFSSVLIVPLARRVGDIWAVVAVQALSLPFLVALGAVPVLAVASIIYLIRGPLMNAGNAPLQTILMGAVPPEERIVGSGVYNVSWQVAGAVGAGLGGALIDQAGYPVTFVTAAVLYACSVALLAWWFGLSHRDKRAIDSPVGAGSESAEESMAVRQRSSEHS